MYDAKGKWIDEGLVPDTQVYGYQNTIFDFLDGMEDDDAVEVYIKLVMAEPVSVFGPLPEEEIPF